LQQQRQSDRKTRLIFNLFNFLLSKSSKHRPGYQGKIPQLLESFRKNAAIITLPDSWLKNLYLRRHLFRIEFLQSRPRIRDFPKNGTGLYMAFNLLIENRKTPLRQNPAETIHD
jgi:hypothetical protein